MTLSTRTYPALTTLILYLLTAPIGQAQKVDLDRFYFDVSYLRLPALYIDPAQRTFGVKVISANSVHSIYSEADVYDKLYISGYQKVEANPTIRVNVNFNDVRFEKTDIQTRTVENKDKDGKVTSRSYYYTLVATYSSGGGYQVYGPRDDDPAQKPADDNTKSAKPNRFLQAIVSNDKAPELANKKMIKSGFFTNRLTYSTKEYNSSADASRYFEQNQASIRGELITNYVTNAINEVNSTINSTYGYVPTQSREYLWILDSKSHPEYETQQEAIRAVKDLMKTMSATESLTTLAQNLKPVMDYFETLKTKYTGDDKRERKMRYSAYYNLATLYYFLDQPNKAIDEANGLIKNDYDTSDGKKYIELASDLLKDLDKHRIDSRHMKL